MNIQEAIEKAGPDGEIRRSEWEKNDGASLIIPDNTGMNLEAKSSEYDSTLSVADLTATDWEVVEPETIEVGDVVHQCLNDNAVVRAVCKINDEACIQWDDGSIGIYPFDKLTLIRKAPRKHVFEGVEFSMEDMSAKMVSWKGNVGDMYPFSDKGKTYRMELTEEADVS
jgi:hypothetical protein